MKLTDLLEDKKEKDPDGTYAGVELSKSTKDAIVKYCKDNKIPNCTEPSKLHTTVLYSRKYLPDYKPAGKYDEPMIGTPTEFDVWGSKPTTENPNPKRCLVLQYKCKELSDRHEYLMDKHEATYDYDEYKPHVTFSYDIGDMVIDKLPKFKHDIEIVKEYSEDLNLDWADKSTKKD